MRRHARIQKINPVVCRNRPVIVFSRTVYACKRLFMQQALQPMASRYLFQRFHHQLIVIYRNVCGCINGREFMLCRRDLIVLRFCGYA